MSTSRLALSAITITAVVAFSPTRAAIAADTGSGASRALPASSIYAITCGHLGVPCVAPKPKSRRARASRRRTVVYVKRMDRVVRRPVIARTGMARRGMDWAIVPR